MKNKIKALRIKPNSFHNSKKCFIYFEIFSQEFDFSDWRQNNVLKPKMDILHWLWSKSNNTPIYLKNIKSFYFILWKFLRSMQTNESIYSFIKFTIIDFLHTTPNTPCWGRAKMISHMNISIYSERNLVTFDVFSDVILES